MSYHFLGYTGQRRLLIDYCVTKVLNHSKCSIYCAPSIALNKKNKYSKIILSREHWSTCMVLPGPGLWALFILKGKLLT